MATSRFANASLSRRASVGAVVSLSLVAAAGVVTAPRAAHAQACGMGDVDFYTVERTNVARADELLQQGETKKAASLIQRTWPRMHEAVPKETSPSVIADGVRVMALAAARSGGDVGSELGWSSWTPAERAANVAWGVSRLRMLVTTNPYSTLAKTDLGEALARSPRTREEAKTLLETLETTNDVVTAEGFAALALVRDEAGDTAGAAFASRECERRASNVAVQCAAAIVHAEAVVTAAR